MQRLPLIIAFAAASCVHQAPRYAPWTVRGDVEESTRAQALALVDATKRFLPGSLASGMGIALLPDINARCFSGLPADAVVYGCIGFGVIYVKWPHPSCAPDADLTCSALSHELCHAAGLPEAQADACALMVNLEYRRSLP